MTPSENKVYGFQEKLLKKYKGKVLQDVLRGEILKTALESPYIIKDSKKIRINGINQKKVKSQILRDMKLIPGIGNCKERSLKDKGYETIEDLLDHPKFSTAAAEFLELIYPTYSPALMNYISGRYSGSHSHLLLCSCLQKIENFLFFDIETLGLKNLPIILIGTARINKNRIEVTQYLSKDLENEKAVLHGFLEDLDDEHTFVTFNGRSFDLPFIRSRLRHHNIPAKLDHRHLDLLHFSRRMWGQGLPNCRLQTLEEHLFKLERQEDVPSSQVPDFYKKYLETGNIGPLLPIIEHNQQDVITLALILSRLYDEMD